MSLFLMIQQTNIIDSLIYTGVVLLVLSQVCEKITTFIRNYLVSSKISAQERLRHRKITKILRYYINKVIKWLLSIILILDTESDIQRGKSGDVPKDQQPRVEFAITKLSLLVGFLLAFLFHADLFKILGGKNPPHEVLHWGKGLVNFKDCLWNLIVKHNTEAWDSFKPLIGPCIETFFGCLATGFLLTFGSKFFHDLLEILYEIKRAKRNLEDERVYRSQDLVTLKERLQSKFDDPVKVVLERHKERLMKQFPNLVSISRVFDDMGNSQLEIRVADDHLEEIRKYTFDYLENGEVKQLPNGQILYKSKVGKAKPLGKGKLYVGNWIYNKATQDNKGTLGFFATKLIGTPPVATPVLVTCYHVLRTENHGWSGLGNVDVSKNRVFGKPVSDDPNAGFTEIGVLISGVINEWLDCAVVKLYPGFEYFNEDSEIGVFSLISTSTLEAGSTVEINGAKSIKVEGKASSCENAVRIDYNERIWEINDLICIENTQNPFNALAQDGDSGAVVIDLANNAVGMVIAADDKLTYAIPIQRILKSFELQ